MLKQTLQVMSFVYTQSMNSPNSDLVIQNLTLQKLFESIHHIMTVKLSLHHSHITRKNYGFAHDCCKRKVTGNLSCFTYLAHNVFGFDFFFFFFFFAY